MSPAVPLRHPARRSPRLLVAMTLAAGALAGVAPPASAAPCSGTSGVTVVVDTGSSIITRCAPGDPSSGISALTSAGFSVVQVTGQPGFVCRINSFPSTSCARTPPSSAYWSYWHARRGGSWSYSQVGAGSYNPKPGTVEGWRFGSGQRPRTAPPAATAPAPKAPAPTTRPTTPRPAGTPAQPPPSGAGAPAPVDPAPPGTPTRAMPTTSPRTSATPSPGRTSPGPSATPTATASTPGAKPSPEDIGAVRAAARRESGDRPGGGTLAVGAALVLLVTGAAGWTVWKRRG